MLWSRQVPHTEHKCPTVLSLTAKHARLSVFLLCSQGIKQGFGGQSSSEPAPTHEQTWTTGEPASMILYVGGTAFFQTGFKRCFAWIVQKVRHPHLSSRQLDHSCGAARCDLELQYAQRKNRKLSDLTAMNFCKKRYFLGDQKIEAGQHSEETFSGRNNHFYI